MAEPADQTITRLPSRFSADSHKSAEKPHKTPLTCEDIDDDEKFIRMMIHLALKGERITGASEEGGHVTTAEEQSDPFHVPLPDEVPVHNSPQSSPGSAGAGGGPQPAEQAAATPVDGAVDGPVDAVDAQVSALEGGKTAPRGSGAEAGIPPMPSRPPAVPSPTPDEPAGDPDWWRVIGDEPTAADASRAAPRDAEPSWWDALYKHQDADLDTYTGHVLTVPADGEVQKTPEPEHPEPDDAEAEEPSARQPPAPPSPAPQQPVSKQSGTQPSGQPRQWKPTAKQLADLAARRDFVHRYGSAALAGWTLQLDDVVHGWMSAAATGDDAMASFAAMSGMALGWWATAPRDRMKLPVAFRLAAVFGVGEIGWLSGPDLIQNATVPGGTSLAEVLPWAIGLGTVGALIWANIRTAHWWAPPQRWLWWWSPRWLLVQVPLSASAFACWFYGTH
ncbi:hypothetical protein ACFY91_25405 [Streptomyces albogriseolus]|uniref:hypothetical protein n=1 Tax=Streptomyces albogriseolus TaxID=1887 RepID=UPI0036E852F1